MFETAKLKIERADHHIDDLDTTFSRFVRDNQYEPSVANHPETETARIHIEFARAAPPLNWYATIIGDAIHNLRTALDHMTWEMVGNDGGTQNRQLKFPVGNSRARFEVACNGIRTPSQVVKDALVALEAFPGGKGETLYQLSLLDNADKHTVLTPIVNGSHVTKLTVIRRDGSIEKTFDRVDLVGDRSPNAFFLVSGLHDGRTVRLNADSAITPNVFFGQVEGFALTAVVPSLINLRHSTSDAIKLVEWRLGP